MENQKNVEHIEQKTSQSKIAVVVATVLGATVASNAHSAVDVSSAVNTLVTDGTSAISAVGVGLLTLAGVAVVFKWVKASFFS